VGNVSPVGAAGTMGDHRRQRREPVDKTWSTKTHAAIDIDAPPGRVGKGPAGDSGIKIHHITDGGMAVNNLASPEAVKQCNCAGRAAAVREAISVAHLDKQLSPIVKAITRKNPPDGIIHLGNRAAISRIERRINVDDQSLVKQRHRGSCREPREMIWLDSLKIGGPPSILLPNGMKIRSESRNLPRAKTIGSQERHIVIAKEGVNLPTGGSDLPFEPANEFNDANAIGTTIEIVAGEAKRRVPPGPCPGHPEQTGATQDVGQLFLFAVEIAYYENKTHVRNVIPATGRLPLQRKGTPVTARAIRRAPRGELCMIGGKSAR
jgi:hypothetical protein